MRGRSVNSKGNLSDRERFPPKCAAAPRWMMQGNLRRHRAHRADWRSLLLEAPGPHRMMSGAIATDALCRQAELVQWTHHQQLVRCNSCKVETVPALRICA